MLPLFFGALVLALYMSVLFFISLVRKDNGVADVGYGIGFLVLMASVISQTKELSWFAVFMCGLLFLWGIRLSSRIAKKNKGKPEDFRYHAWRKEWGKWFLVRSFFQVYMLQGLVIYTVSLPVMLAISFPTDSVSLPLFAIGLALWCVGFYFEAAGDKELDAFISQPENKGKIMTEGLWKYTRHPNYFGESLMWWGMATLAASLSTFALLGFVSPVLITFLLLQVSGVPMLEKRFEGNPDWEAYKKRTSVFLPLPPRSH